MDSQTGRYRLGLASNLIAKQGCLEEMTPFQTLNYNRGLCALKKYAHLNESKPEILFVFRVKASTNITPLAHIVKAFLNKGRDLFESRIWK